jgi:hypothetical protein
VQELEGGGTEGLGVKAHGRQRRVGQPCEVEVVEADDGHLAGHVDPQLVGRRDHAGGKQVVVAEEGARAVRAAQQLLGDRDRAGRVEGGKAGDLRVGILALGAQVRGPGVVAAVEGLAAGRRAEVADAGMAKRVEVRHRRRRSPF